MEATIMDEKMLGYMNYSSLSQEIEKIRFNAVGEEYCRPGHFNGPKIREHYLFHFVVSGEGVFQIRDKKYHLHENQGFLIPDSSIVYYEADKRNPWHYCWLNMQSKGAKTFFDSLSLSVNNPIYTARNNNDIYLHFKELIKQAKSLQINPYNTAISLYRCLLSLQNHNTTHPKNIIETSFQEQYIQSAELYIASNYHRENFRIEDIAKHIGINRSYLTRLFAQYHNISPQQYLINFRMQKAKTLLNTTIAPINIIAYSVGYSDISIFSRTYKKYYGISPKNDRTPTLIT